MRQFASLQSYHEFERSVKTEARFVPKPCVRDFLETVGETVQQRLKPLSNGTSLYRAQRGGGTKTLPMRIGNTEEYEDVEVENGAPLSAERMMPKAEFAGDGRVNPRGIPCLYLADTYSAVISEMRPWIGSYVTIAKFETVRDCLLVDCSLNTTQSWDHINLHTEPDIETKEQAVWGDIGFAFSKPVTRDEPYLDYVPTQILAETFRSLGYDGIVYKSLLDKDGKNIALFDPNAAKMMDRCLYKLQAALFKSEKVDLEEGCRARPAQGRWPEVISSPLEEMQRF